MRVPGSTDVLKITVHADRQANDSVAYTNGESWALPKDVWRKLAHHVVEEDITVTVQTPAGGATSVKFQVAPVGAGGSMVFWAANPAAARKMNVESMSQGALVDDSMLMGFTVGNETTVPTLKIDQVKQPVTLQDGRTQGSHCIGCHTATPDGDYVAFVDAWPWSAAFAGVKPGMVGAALPGFAGGACTDWNSCRSAEDLLAVSVERADDVFAGALVARWFGRAGRHHRDAGPGHHDAVGTTGRPTGSRGGSPGSTSIEGDDDDEPADRPQAGRGVRFLARTGDPHPGRRVSDLEPRRQFDRLRVGGVPEAGPANGCGTQDGRLYKGAADLYEVPYANRAGGAATAGARRVDADYEEYYPAFSPDDRLIAYTRVPAGQEMYANPSAEMWVVPHQAGAQARSGWPPTIRPRAAARRARASTTTGRAGRPTGAAVGTTTYYWLIFSSNRYGLPPVTTSSNGSPRPSRFAALHHRRRRRGRRDQGRHRSPGDLPLEPAAEPAQHDARLGKLPHHSSIERATGW